MKKGKAITIMTVAVLGLAAAAYAGQGMGPGKGQGMGQEVSAGKRQCGNRGMRRGHDMPKSMWRHGVRAEMMQKVMRQLDLTDEQKKQIRLIRLEAQKERIEAKIARVRQGRGLGTHRGKRGRSAMDLSRFMTPEGFDKAAFKKAMQERWAAREKMRQLRQAERLERMADRMEKVFNVLTPAQREKLIKLSQKN